MCEFSVCGVGFCEEMKKVYAYTNLIFCVIVCVKTRIEQYAVAI